MAEDESTPSSGEAEKETKEELQDGKDDSEGTDPEKSGEDGDGKPPKEIPYQRFKEVNDKLKGVARVASWFQQNVGTPEEVLEFKHWKKQQDASKESKKADDDLDNIPPKELEKFRALMRKADPDYAAYLKQQESAKADEEERGEALWDDTEDEIRALATEAKLPVTDKAFMGRLGRDVMLQVREEPKLMRLWKSGSMRAVKQAFTKEMADRAKHGIGGLQSKASTQRQIGRLPTFPKGGSSAGAKDGKPDKPKGLDKSAHDEAWALLQQAMQND